MKCAAAIRIFFVVLSTLFFSPPTFAKPSTNAQVLERRGYTPPTIETNAVANKSSSSANQNGAPVVSLQKPLGGWTTAMQIEVEGTCSDPSVDPVEVNINGARYFVRTSSGNFSRKFPAASGMNDVSVKCKSSHGEGIARVSQYAALGKIPLKFVLTSDTDGVYTDLHIYEPDGTHVYWAGTHSSSGGLFLLNSQGDSIDQSGYGPYVYLHQSPPVGVYRVSVNYWPGGAKRPTLAHLDVLLDEGSEAESRQSIEVPLLHPDETRTLAYVIVPGNRQKPWVYIPGGGPVPDEVQRYQKEIEPKIKSLNSDEWAMLAPRDEPVFRAALSQLALAQARKMSVAWEPKQRDCAGMLRFLFREAVAPRTGQQRERLGLSPKFGFPGLVHPLPALQWRLAGQNYSYFADAESLLSHNFIPLAENPLDLRTGDVLAFRRDGGSEWSYHLMLYLEAKSPGEALVIYHNGAEGSEGAVRVLRFSELLTTPHEIWRPTTRNPNFIGAFRWARFPREDVA